MADDYYGDIPQYNDYDGWNGYNSKPDVQPYYSDTNPYVGKNYPAPVPYYDAASWGSSSDMDKKNALVGTDSRIGVLGARTTPGGGGGGTGYGGIPMDYPSTVPKFVAPSYTPPPVYTPPAWNERRVGYQTQKAASPYLSEIRRSIRQAITRANASGSPILAKYQMGGAMDSAGDAFGKIMGQAGAEGRAIYRDEYGRDLNAYNMNYTRDQDIAKMDYTGRMAAAQANFASLLQMFQQQLQAYYKSPGTGGYNLTAQTTTNSRPTGDIYGD